MGRNLKKVPIPRSITLEDNEIAQLLNISNQMEQLELVQLGYLYRLEKKYQVYIPANANLDANNKALIWMEEDSNITEFPTKETEGEDTENNDTDSSD